MASLNKVILIGNLGKDPEARTMGNGGTVASFSIATTEKWKGQDGQMVENTEWHNIVMYKQIAEIAVKYLKKGSQVYLEGRIKTEKYMCKTTGIEKTATKIICDSMKMLGGKSESATPNAYQATSNQQPQRNEYADAKSGRAAPPTAAFDDDIPFNWL